MKPAIFNTDMVRAILDGRKTQTRRRGATATAELVYRCSFETPSAPYKKGDIIYVRETFARGVEHDENDYPLTTEDGSDWIWTTYYRADNNLFNWVNGDDDDCNVPWKPSIHMPKEYARLFLRVKDVRIERLNEISEEDLYSEGIIPHSPQDCPCNYTEYPCDSCWNYSEHEDMKGQFKELWESIYGKGSFNDDYVWVVEFEKISKEEAMK